MRRSLQSVRTRVDRLASKIGSVIGCPICQEDEAQIRFCWHDKDAEHPRSVHDELAALPQSNTCAACGRTYALRYTVIGWMSPCEVADCTCGQTTKS